MFPYGFQYFITIIIVRQEEYLINNFTINIMEMKRHILIFFSYIHGGYRKGMRSLLGKEGGG
jgi:hypothetical protein